MCIPCSGSDKVLNLLVESGANASYVTNSGKTALHLAALNRKNYKNIAINFQIFIHENFFSSLAGDNVEIAEFLIKMGLDVDFVDDKGNTALHIAAKKGISCVCK